MPIRLLGLVLILALPLSAQVSFSYPDFSSTTDLSLQGNYLLETGPGASLHVTDLFAGTGSVFCTQRVPVTAGFDTTFDFSISGWLPFDSGAWGLALVIHHDPAGAGFLGSTAPFSVQGWNGVDGAVVISFSTADVGEDEFFVTFQNSEVEIRTRGANAITLPTTNPPVATVPTTSMVGGPHTGRVRYLPGSGGAPGVLEVYVNDLTVPVLSEPFDFEIEGAYPGTPAATGMPAWPGGTAWVGFTAQNFGSSLITPYSQRNTLHDWTWSSNEVNACARGTVTDPLSGDAVDTLFVNGQVGDDLRTVDLIAGLPWTISAATPPGSAPGAPLAIAALSRFPTSADVFSTLWGDLCFVPSLVTPAPDSFMLVDGLTGSAAVLPMTSAPLAVTVPPLFFEFDLTLQGATLTDAADPQSVVITNAVQIRHRIAPAPNITAVLPPTFDAGDLVTVQGSGFQNGLTLNLNGVTITPTSTSPTDAQFVAPVAVSCTANLTLSNPDGQSAAATAGAEPSISNQTSTGGPAAGGGVVVFVGTGLDNVSAVDFGGVPATIQSQVSSALIVTAPPGTAGTTVTVNLSTPQGCSATGTYSYQ